jgi:hypothetical protein
MDAIDLQNCRHCQSVWFCNVACKHIAYPAHRVACVRGFFFVFVVLSVFAIAIANASIELTHGEVGLLM